MKLRVRWADSDPAGRINFPRYFDYMEDGEAELMRSVGLSYAKLPPGTASPASIPSARSGRSLGTTSRSRCA